MSITATASFTFRGDYQTHGGRSQYEAGGSGTTFLSFPAEEGGKVETTLILDNQGKQPLAEFVNDVAADSARTYLVVSESESFTRVRVLGGAHLAVKKRDNNVGEVSVTIGNLEGDNSGMIHSSKEMRVTVVDGVDPFPTSLRVYDSSEMDLHQVGVDAIWASFLYILLVLLHHSYSSIYAQLWHGSPTK